MSLLQPENFTQILRVMNTNIDGNQKIMYAMTGIRGIGRRFSNLICKKGQVDLDKRAGELNVEELEALMEIVSNPEQYKIPVWFLNRQKDYKDGKNMQTIAQAMDNKWREDFDRLKKARVHRGLRHWWGWKVRGQHTKTTGRRGKTVGIGKKK